MNGEDGNLAVAQTGLGSQQQALGDQTAFGRGVGTVVQRGEGHLCAGAGVHGVQIVHQSLHGLIGGALGGFCSIFAGEGQNLVSLFANGGLQTLQHGGVKAVGVVVHGFHAGLLFHIGQQGASQLFAGVDTGVHIQRLGKIVPIGLTEGLCHAGSQRIVKVGNALTAVLIVLIGLQSDTGQSGVGTDVLGLPQEAVTGGETVLEQLEQVDLAAGGGQGVEVHIVDMDVAFPMGAAVLGVQNEHLAELLGAFGAVLQHGAHGGVAVDVGILTLDVVLQRGLEGQILINLHQAGVHFAGAGALIAVQNVLFGGTCMAVFHQNLFHGILDLLHGGQGDHVFVVQQLHDLLCQPLGHLPVAAAGSLCRSVDGIGDLFDLEGGPTAVALDDFCDHEGSSFPYIHAKPACRPKYRADFVYCLLYTVEARKSRRNLSRKKVC